LVLTGSAGWLFHKEENKDGNDGARDCGDDKGVAPAITLADDTANEIAKRSTHRNGDIEDGENAIALLRRIEIGEERRSKDAEAGFANAERGVPQVERIVGRNRGGEEVNATP